MELRRHLVARHLVRHQAKGLPVESCQSLGETEDPATGLEATEAWDTCIFRSHYNYKSIDDSTIHLSAS
jgi:hypothetical protein